LSEKCTEIAIGKCLVSDNCACKQSPLLTNRPTVCSSALATGHWAAPMICAQAIPSNWSPASSDKPTLLATQSQVSPKPPRSQSNRLTTHDIGPFAGRPFRHRDTVRRCWKRNVCLSSLLSPLVWKRKAHSERLFSASRLSTIFDKCLSGSAPLCSSVERKRDFGLTCCVLLARVIERKVITEPEFFFKLFLFLFLVVFLQL